MAKKKDASEKGFPVELKRTNPQNLQPIFVNDMFINHSKNEYFITFSLIEPPIAFNEKQASTIEEVEVPARVKIIVTPDLAKRIIKAIQKNIDTFEGDTEEK